MLTEISGVLASLNAARQIGSAVLELKENEAVREKVMELRDKISDAQDGLYRISEERAQLANKVRELEEKLSNIERWDQRAAGFELQPFEHNSGVLAYRERDVPLSPPYCATCFGNKNLSIMQSETRVPGRSHVFVCFTCGTELYVSGMRYQEHKSTPKRR